MTPGVHCLIDTPSHRRAPGLTNPRVLRNVYDRSEITVVFDASDLKSAEEFVASSDLKKAIEDAGVTKIQTIYFLEDA
jgi:hypothetical protein